MSASADEVRASIARLLRGTTWSIGVLIVTGVALHLIGLLVLSPLVVGTGLGLLAIARWQARLVERGDPAHRQFLLFHVAFMLGITAINYGLGGIRFPGGVLFYTLLVANSGFGAPLRYAFANLSALAYALVLGLEAAHVLPALPGAFSGEVAPPPWRAQVVFVALLVVSLNLLAAVTQRLIGLLEWSRQRLAHANLELEGWRQSLADQVRERTRELEAANRELDARSRALQEGSQRLRTFVYTVTHDLKTPVNNVVLLSDLMLARDAARLSDEGRRDLEHIGQLAASTDRMIRDLFALFQITSAQESPAWIRLDEVVRRASADLGPQIAAKRITVEVEPLPRLWAAPGKLRHVVGNLLANAVKHVPGGTGTIRVGGAQEGTRVHFWIADNGVGIAPEYHEGIFKLFGRVPGGETPTDGSGVGLAIVRGLVDEHHGRVWVDSAPGAGSTFHVELPTPPDPDALPLCSAA